ncbi:WD40 repeat-like protein [Pluteus cervinus]|uniref:WD40 repeat-like protein n=1 Tax=Pluteus cervinus TaxID=181527 RepID=A0ACD3B2K2_9AGAR|nr:WD40 repeat-like protein [Pluteus cervinus]
MSRVRKSNNKGKVLAQAPTFAEEAKVLLHVVDVTTTFASPSDRHIRLELANPGDAKPKITCRSKPATGGRSVTWDVDQYLTVTSAQFVLRVWEQRTLHADKLMAEHKVTLDDITSLFLKMLNGEELEYAVPNSNVVMIIQRDSLSEILKTVVLPESLSEKLGDCQRVLEFLLGMTGPITDLHPAAQAVQNVLDSVLGALEKQQVCYESLGDLFQLMGGLLSHFQKLEELEDFGSLKKVVKKMLAHMKTSLDTVSTYNQMSTTGRFFHFVIHSEQEDQFLQLSNTFNRLLQEFDKAFQVELAILLSQNQVLKYLDKLNYVEIIPGSYCLPDTRVSALANLQRWAQAREFPIFWLCGIAGTGKSTIAATFVQQLLDQNRLAAFFTCRRDHKALRNPLQLLQNICYRLAYMHKPYGRLVAQSIEKDAHFGSGTATIKSLFSSLFFRPLKQLDVATAPKQKLVIVIDALDECGIEEERVELLNGLLDLSETCHWIKFFLTSRLNSEIEDVLASDAYIHKLELNDSEQDIRTFFSTKCSKFGFSALNLDNLVGAAGGLFIWAQTAFNYLKSSLNYGRALEKLLTVHLSQSGNPLYNLYHTILSDAIENNSLANEAYQYVVGTILLAGMPITITTLQQLVQNEVSNQVVVDIVNRLHAVLIRESDGIVKAIHPSFAEYLLNENTGCTQRFKVLVLEGHLRMYKTCVEIMQLQLKFNVCHLESSCVLNKEVQDLPQRIKDNILSSLQYASLFWMHHYGLLAMDTSDVKQSVDKMLESLLSNPSGLFWVEIISLIDAVYPTLESLNNICWSTENEFSLVLKEYYHFMNMFKGAIIASVPHIYISGLALLPKSSRLAQIQIAGFSSILEVKKGFLNEWLNSMMVQDVNSEILSVAYSSNGKHVAIACEDEVIIILDARTGKPAMDPLEGHTSSVNSLAYSSDGLYIASGSTDCHVRIWNAQTGQLALGPLGGHTDVIRAIAYCPDGNYVVTGSDDLSLRIWDSKTGTEVRGPLLGHTDEVVSVAYSPDGKYIASGSVDSTIIIWDVTTGKQKIKPLDSHVDAVWSVAYSPDGKFIASGSGDEYIIIWDAADGKEINTLSDHNDAVMSVTYSPNGKNIASGSADTTVIVWDAENGEIQFGPLEGHSNSVSSVAYSPDGVFIVSGSSDMTIRIWNANSGQSALTELSGHNGAISQVCFSPDGQYFISGSDDMSTRVWEATVGEMEIELAGEHDGPVYSIAYLPGEKQIAFACNNLIRVWDCETEELVLGSFEGHDDDVYQIACSPDGIHISSCSADQTIRIWNIESREIAKKPFAGHSGEVNAIAYSPDGSLLVSGSDDKTIRIWGVETGSLVMDPLQGHTDTIWSIAYLPNGSQIVSGSSDQTVRIWSAESGQILVGPLYGHTEGIYSVAYSPNGSHIASGSMDDTIRIWDASTGELIIGPIAGHKGDVTCVSYSADGQYILSGSEDMTLRIWNANTGEMLLDPLELHENTIWAAIYSPDSQCIVTGSSDYSLRMWDALTGKHKREMLRGHRDCVTTVTYSPDQKYIATGSDDNTVWVWDAHTGQPIRGFEGHNDTINSVVWSPDGQCLVSGSDDKTIRIWHVHTGEPAMEPLIGHEGTIYSVAYSPSGEHIVSGSSDQTIRIWSSSTGSLITGPIMDTDEVDAITYSPDGRYIISAGINETISIWDTTTGELAMSPLEGHENSIYAIACSPDGKYIASGSVDTTIRIWNLDTGKLAMDPLEGHKSDVNSVAYSPDGVYIVSGSADMTVRLWNLMIGQSAMIISGGYTGSMQLASGLDVSQVNSQNQSLLHFPTQKHIVPHTHQTTSDFPCTACTGFLAVDHRDILSLALVKGTLSKSGWLIYNDKHILWIPPHYRTGFLGQQILVISQDPLKQQIVVDWSKFVYENKWASVYDKV